MIVFIKTEEVSEKIQVFYFTDFTLKGSHKSQKKLTICICFIVLLIHRLNILKHVYFRYQLTVCISINKYFYSVEIMTNNMKLIEYFEYLKEDLM